MKNEIKIDELVDSYIKPNAGRVWELMNEFKKNGYNVEDVKECFGYMYNEFNDIISPGRHLGVVTDPFYSEFDLMRTCYAVLGIESNNGNVVMAPSSFNRRLNMICKGFNVLYTLLNTYLVDRYYYNYSYKLSLLPEEIREHWMGDRSIADIPGLYFFALEVVSYLLLTPNEGKKRYPVVELLEYIGAFTEIEAENIKTLYKDLFNYSNDITKYQDKEFLCYYDKVVNKFEESMNFVSLGFDKDRFPYMYKLFNDLMDDLYKRHIKKEKMYNKIIPIEIFRVGGIDED